jgi:ADP-heptose:LPS heptosyltransferase
MAQQKILLALLNSNGDCLYGTVVARQIKEIDFPGCHLTWAVNNRCKQTLLLNPHVDELWEIPTAKSLTTTSEWRKFVKQAEQRKANGDFDQIFYIQIIDKNVIHLNGEVRQSIYKNYPHPITVSNQPVLQLSETEINNAKTFAAIHNLNRFKHVILFECGPDSFKSALNPDSALQFAKEIITNRNDIAFILSSNKKINETNEQIIDGSSLTFRENAAFTHYCDFFIGCSSGISWLCTSTAAKSLPKILVINDNMMLNTSMCDDHIKAGLSDDNIIEMHESKDVLINLNDALNLCLLGKFNVAKENYHQQFHRKNFKYLYKVSQSSFSQMNFFFPLKALKTAIKIDGFHFNAVYQIIKSYFKLPFWVIGSFFKK